MRNGLLANLYPLKAALTESEFRVKIRHGLGFCFTPKGHQLERQQDKLMESNFYENLDKFQKKIMRNCMEDCNHISSLPRCLLYVFRYCYFTR